MSKMVGACIRDHIKMFVKEGMEVISVCVESDKITYGLGQRSFYVKGSLINYTASIRNHEVVEKTFEKNRIDASIQNIEKLEKSPDNNSLKVPIHVMEKEKIQNGLDIGERADPDGEEATEEMEEEKNIAEREKGVGQSKSGNTGDEGAVGGAIEQDYAELQLLSDDLENDPDVRPKDRRGTRVSHPKPSTDLHSVELKKVNDNSLSLPQNTPDRLKFRRCDSETSTTLLKQPPNLQINSDSNRHIDRTLSEPSHMSQLSDSELQRMRDLCSQEIINRRSKVSNRQKAQKVNIIVKNKDPSADINSEIGMQDGYANQPIATNLDPERERGSHYFDKGTDSTEEASFQLEESSGSVCSDSPHPPVYELSNLNLTERGGGSRQQTPKQVTLRTKLISLDNEIMDELEFKLSSGDEHPGAPNDWRHLADALQIKPSKQDYYKSTKGNYVRQIFKSKEAKGKTIADLYIVLKQIDREDVITELKDENHFPPD